MALNSSEICDKYHECCIENKNFTLLCLVKLNPFSMYHSWYLSQISQLHVHLIANINFTAIINECQVLLNPKTLLNKNNFSKFEHNNKS